VFSGMNPNGSGVFRSAESRLSCLLRGWSKTERFECELVLEINVELLFRSSSDVVTVVVDATIVCGELITRTDVVTSGFEPRVVMFSRGAMVLGVRVSESRDTNINGRDGAGAGDICVVTFDGGTDGVLSR
jgi:hypothetical protein